MGRDGTCSAAFSASVVFRLIADLEDELLGVLGTFAFCGLDSRRIVRVSPDLLHDQCLARILKCTHP